VIELSKVCSISIFYWLPSFLNKVVHEISVKQKADRVAYDACVNMVTMEKEMNGTYRQIPSRIRSRSLTLLFTAFATPLLLKLTITVYACI
jgi:hypothetical protein